MKDVYIKETSGIIIHQIKSLTVIGLYWMIYIQVEQGCEELSKAIEGTLSS